VLMRGRIKAEPLFLEDNLLVIITQLNAKAGAGDPSPRRALGIGPARRTGG